MFKFVRSLTGVVWIFEVCFAILLLLMQGIAKLLWRISLLDSFSSYIAGFFHDPARLPDYDADFIEMARNRGYSAEQHYLVTSDGYVLCLHRLTPLSGAPEPGSREVVFLQHGLMQCSESWIASERDNALPCMLVDHGYDVWLGNNRGNRYSQKHMTVKRIDDKFWDFSLDHLATIDLPASIEYVTDFCKVSQLSYIGFSQGTAQAFACFSKLPDVADKIKVFIALAPTSRVVMHKTHLINMLTGSKAWLLYTLFGRQAMLPESLFWRRTLSVEQFTWLIDNCLHLLFDWKVANISQHRKAPLYFHLYSMTSVRTIMHWFQIARGKRFQMFDENNLESEAELYQGYVLPAYPIDRIRTKMALFYGGLDNLPDIAWMKETLPKGTRFTCVDNYEHLDFLWADSVVKNVYEHLLPLLPRSHHAYEPEKAVSHQIANGHATVD
eukprot:TRINITY_DN10665_c0_g1_i1.p1 TRINITY_DN10665_c0_g1~~TRINITY_DN10665_c0_g1_i1.p1  ORF type:complete len:440 (-),score=155.33 TRINITY_DN10665_c0_g1_i1:337-1656(-)